MTELDELRSAILELFPDTLDVVADTLSDETAKAMEASRDQLAAGEYVVVVCGEFRRGKSSLLNALLRRRGLFPVDVDITTAVVSELRWGEVEQAVVHFAPSDPDDPTSTPEPVTIGLAEVAQYVTEQANPDNRRDVVRVEIQAPIEQLRTGLVLVDTPGVGSENAAHTAATRAYLPYADAIVFVGSAVQPLSTVELSFLAHAVDQCPIVVTATTMMDKVIDPKPVIDEARRRIAEVLATDAAELVVVGVSALRMWNGVAADDEELIAESGLPELSGHIWQGLAIGCGAAQCDLGLDAVDAAIAEGQAPLVNDLAALGGDDAVKRIDAELTRLRARADELRSGRNVWRDELRHDLDVSARSVRDQLIADFEAVREEFIASVNRADARTNPNAMVRTVSESMVDVVHRADAGLRTVIGEVAARYAKITEIDLVVSDADPLRPPQSLGNLGPQATRRGNGFNTFRSAWSGGTMGFGAGLLLAGIASVFLPVTAAAAGVAALVGQIAGWFGGGRQARMIEHNQQDAAFRAWLREQIMPKIDSARRQAESQLSDQIKDHKQELVNAIESRVSAAVQSLDASITRLRETRNRTAQENAEHLVRLRTELGRYEALLTRLTELRGRVARLAESWR